MAKITFEDKVTIDPKPEVAVVNKLTDADTNEIKTSVNSLYDTVDAQALEIIEAQNALSGLGDNVSSLDTRVSTNEGDILNLQTEIENLATPPSTTGETEYEAGVEFLEENVGDTIWATDEVDISFHTVLQPFTVGTPADLSADIIAGNISSALNVETSVKIADHNDSSSVLYPEKSTVKNPNSKVLYRAKVQTNGDTPLTDTNTWESITTDNGEITGVNTQTGLTYTLSITDKGGLVVRQNAADNTITIPPDASVNFPLLSVVIFQWAEGSAGQVEILGGSGVTLNSIKNSSGSVKIELAGGFAFAIKTAANTWRVGGGLEV